MVCHFSEISNLYSGLAIYRTLTVEFNVEFRPWNSSINISVNNTVDQHKLDNRKSCEHLTESALETCLIQLVTMEISHVKSCNKC